jgi:hypothetical protein
VATVPSERAIAGTSWAESTETVMDLAFSWFKKKLVTGIVAAPT